MRKSLIISLLILLLPFSFLFIVADYTLLIVSFGKLRLLLKINKRNINENKA